MFVWAQRAAAVNAAAKKAASDPRQIRRREYEALVVEERTLISDIEGQLKLYRGLLKPPKMLDRKADPSPSDLRLQKERVEDLRLIFRGNQQAITQYRNEENEAHRLEVRGEGSHYIRVPILSMDDYLSAVFEGFDREASERR